MRRKDIYSNGEYAWLYVAREQNVVKERLMGYVKNIKLVMGGSGGGNRTEAMGIC